MPTPSHPGKKLLPNPFYLLLLVASTLFVVTCLGYLVSPAVLDQAAREAANGRGGRPGTSSLPERLAAWLDRRGPLALAVESFVMIVAGFLAMATDRWFPEKPALPLRAKGPGPGQPSAET